MQRIITISPPVISSELELKTFLGGICLEVVILTVNLIEAVYILGEGFFYCGVNLWSYVQWRSALQLNFSVVPPDSCCHH